jgi:Na+-translocating ferredoxin:NAD+ oxidoreductase subunit B
MFDLRLIISSSLVLLVLGIAFGTFLGYFAKIFEVKKDPNIERVLGILPGVNCGACGYSGCSSYAESIAHGSAPINLCNVGGKEVVDNIANLLGLNANNYSVHKKVPVLICQGGKDETVKNAEMNGIYSCKIASNLKFNEKLCTYSCLGLGDCAVACPFEAIEMNKNGLPEINSKLCTGCGICVKTCPKEILQLHELKERVLALCNNSTKGPTVSSICKKGCITCYLCEKKCPRKAIKIENNLPFIDESICDMCGICVDVCPTKTISCIFKNK